ncbi:MAG: carbohydrate kinase [Celeribacter sp.]|jgi:fructokinase
MIICAGEALIDMLPRQSAEGESCFAPVPGGAVFNTAIALGRLDVPVGLVSGISTDLMGQRLISALESSHVDHAPAHRSDRPTTLAFVELKNGQARYAFYDEGTAGRMLEEADLPTDLGDAAALFIGGISLVSEPCASSYEALATREAGKRVLMIDPNIRPGFVTDSEAYRARIDRLIGMADIVKLSDEDLRWLYGAEAPLDTLARQVLDMGPKLFCLTEGADGVTGYTADGACRVAAEKAEVVDTVGAGDTFNAGLLAGLFRAGKLDRDSIAALDEAALREVIGLGVRAAAVTVARAGANPPTAADLGL